MTIKDKLIAEIARLEKVKALLLRKEAFLDPSNDIVIYSTESIKRILGVDGSTPNNLREALETIVSAINDHIKMLKEMPVVVREQEVVNALDKEYALIEKNNGYINPPVVWDILERDMPISTFESYFSSARFYSALEKINFAANCKFQKSNGAPVDFEITLRKINLRTANVDKFRGISGNLNVTISGADIDPDDIFIIGVEIHESLDSSMLYASDFTYNVERSLHSGETKKNVFNIADTKIGNSSLKADPDLVGMNSVMSATIYWDMIALNNLALQGTTYHSSRPPAFNNGTMIFNSNASLNSISQLSLSGAFMNFEEGLYSCYADTSYYRLLLEGTYTLYSMRTKEKSTLYVPNARPIDVIIREALSEL